MPCPCHPPLQLAPEVRVGDADELRRTLPQHLAVQVHRPFVLRAGVLWLYTEHVPLGLPSERGPSKDMALDYRERAMKGSFLDVLVRHRGTEDVTAAKRLSQELSALCEQLAASLSPLERPAREELLSRVLQRVWGSLDRIDAEATELFAVRENGGAPIQRPNSDMLNALARVAQIQQGMSPGTDDHSLEYLHEARSGRVYDADLGE
jgi:hypothetical protein